MTGYIYIIGNPSFEKDVFKLGYFSGNKSDLEARYHTYYLKNSIVHGMYPVSDRKLAERNLFFKLKNYRIQPNREFFKANIDFIKRTCEDVANYINTDMSNNQANIINFVLY